MSCGRSRWLVSLIQRSNAILKTAIPASAARLAAGSVTPRRRSASASAAASDASLISSRSWSSAFAAMTAWRCRAKSRRSWSSGAGGLEGRGDRVDRRRGIRRAGDGAHEELLQRARAPEQDLALVGEVPEERSLGQPGPLGDLRHRGLLEPALAVELQGRLLEPAARVRLPSTHAPIVA